MTVLSSRQYGVGAHLLTALIGVCFGTVCSRPVLRRNAWAVLLGASLYVADIIIPNCPPTRQLLGQLNADHPHQLVSAMALTAAETAALAFGITAATLWFTRLRD